MEESILTAAFNSTVRCTCILSVYFYGDDKVCHGDTFCASRNWRILFIRVPKQRLLMVEGGWWVVGRRRNCV